MHAIQIFLQHGIDVNYCINGTSLLLLTLLYNGPNEISDILLSQGAKIIDDCQFHLCEMQMMRNKPHNGLTKAIELGFSPLKRNEYGSNYLHSACLHADLNIVQQLLQSKYKDELLDERNNNKNTPFLCASKCENIPILEELLRAGANINDQNKSGRTALLNLCLAKNEQGFQFVISRNADVNLAENNGRVK